MPLQTYKSIQQIFIMLYKSQYFMIVTEAIRDVQFLCGPVQLVFSELLPDNLPE